MIFIPDTSSLNHNKLDALWMVELRVQRVQLFQIKKQLYLENWNEFSKNSWKIMFRNYRLTHPHQTACVIISIQIIHISNFKSLDLWRYRDTVLYWTCRRTILFADTIKIFIEFLDIYIMFSHWCTPLFIHIIILWWKMQ